MEYAWIGFMGGVFAFAHCLGMCGVFPLHISQNAGFGSQLLWHVGRIFIYIFLGSIAGFAGSSLLKVLNQHWIQNFLPITAGAVMMVMGLFLLGVIPVSRSRHTAVEDFLGSVISPFIQMNTTGEVLFLGMASGCLPCPVVLSFLALSMQSGSPLTGMMTMAALGAGTSWSLLLIGFLGRCTIGRLRKWGRIAGGTTLVLLGLLTALRGTDAFHRSFGCHGKQNGSGRCLEELPPSGTRW